MKSSVKYSLFNKDEYTLIIACLFGLASLISVHTNHIGSFLAVLEYIFVYISIVRGKVLDAFLYYLIFTTFSFEVESFLYLGTPPFTLHSFLNPPIVGGWLHIFTIILICFHVRKEYGKLSKETEGYKFLTWLFVLLFTGIFMGWLGYLINDNGIRLRSATHHVLIFSETLRYFSLVTFFWSGLLLSQNCHSRPIILNCCKNILICLCFIAIVSFFMGYEAYASQKETGNMLVPLASLFIPTLLVIKDGYKNLKYYHIVTLITIFVIILSYNRPNVMGSKWYLVLVGTLYMVFVSYLRIKSVAWFVVVAIMGLFVISSFSEVLITFFSNSDYNVWKANQAFGALDIFSHNSFNDWFLSLAPSAAYRIDEPVNIGIEFFEKPLFAPLGKGFGGTTIHHTTLMYWEQGNGTYSDDQIALGAYNAMHESIAVIFLRHGLLGIVFLVIYLIRLIKKIPYSNWTFVGILWFVFFWRYGISFWIGALAMAIALTAKTDVKDRIKGLFS